MKDEQLRAVSVSNRQFVLLQELYRRGGVNLKRLLELSQTTSGSVVRRGLVSWSAKLEAFSLTDAGMRVIEVYKQTDINRSGITRPLSIYIEPRPRKARKAGA